MNVGEGHKEGYLQRRLRTGMVKSLKRKWYVLKDGELRCYQSKDACDDNVEMYQDCLPVHNVQTVRCAHDQHGIEIVTKQKVYILVAASAKDQQAWIKAIYEMMKDDRPRSVSCPVVPSDTSGNRNRSSSGSKIGLGRILPGFNKKSTGDAQCPQSRFYLDPEPEVPIETGNDVDVEQNGGTETPSKVFDGDVFDTQAIIDETYAKVAVDNTVTTVTDKHEVELSVDHGAQSTSLRSPSELYNKEDLSEVEGDQSVHQEDEACQHADEQESGMRELKLLLRNSKIMEDDQSEGNENENFEDEDDGDEDDEPNSSDEEIKESDERLGTTIKSDSAKEDEKSAFERLQELLRT